MNMGIGFSGALNLSVMLTVGLGCWLKRELTSKVKKLEIGDSDPHFGPKGILTKIDRDRK
jgi:hypothetical protein